MARPSASSGSRGWPAQDDDGWGPSTAVYSSSATHGNARAGNPKIGRAFIPAKADDDAWAAAGPRTAREQRAVRAADRRMAESIRALRERRVSERGLPAWAALLLLVAVAALGGAIDTLGSFQVRGGFNIGIIVASVLAILAVRRSHMFPIVIAPPIVYSAGALFQLYVRSSGLHDKKVVLDAAANYLVYGFPAIAAATAAVLIIAGIRLISRR